MSCCPPGSVPSFTDNTPVVGVKMCHDGTEFYATGSASVDGKAIIIISDIFGWDSGRIRKMGDALAAGTGSYVVIPKLLEPAFEGGTDGDALPASIIIAERGADVWPWLKQFSYDILKPKLDVLFSHLKDNGIVTIGVVGFCWGGWVMSHIASERTDIACMVTPHPSIHSIGGLQGQNPADLVANVRVPWLLMPAGNDPDVYLPGGEILDILVANNPASMAVNFPDMKHGWSNRGDVSTDADISRDVDRCYFLMEKFLIDHMK